MPESITARLLARAAREPDCVAVHILRSAARGAFRDEALTLGEWVRGAGTCAGARAAHPFSERQRLVAKRAAGGAAQDVDRDAIWLPRGAGEQPCRDRLRHPRS